LAQGEDEVKVLQLKSPDCYQMSDLIVALPRCPENQELTFTSVKHLSLRNGFLVKSLMKKFLQIISIRKNSFNFDLSLSGGQLLEI
jgi:hypothetical protein